MSVAWWYLFCTAYYYNVVEHTQAGLTSTNCLLQAIKYYRCSLELKPIDPLCFVNLALALIAQECFVEGLEYMERAGQHLEEDKMLSTANI